VVGVNVGFQRVLEPQAVLAQQAHVALRLLDHRIDDHCVVAGIVRDEIAQRGRRWVEKLLEKHLPSNSRPSSASDRGTGELRGGACDPGFVEPFDEKLPAAIIMQIVLGGRAQVRRIVMRVQ